MRGRERANVAIFAEYTYVPVHVSLAYSTYTLNVPWGILESKSFGYVGGRIRKKKTFDI